jgi:transcriptional regulator with XRE-family HTH domain
VNKSKKRVIKDHLAGLLQAIDDAGTSTDVATLEEIRDALEVEATQIHNRMVNAIESNQERLSRDDSVEVEPITLNRISSLHLRRLRKRSGWTQARLAESMSFVGMKWKQVTVAETEAGRRSLTLDEIAALAALFGEPMVQFLLPADGEYVDLPFEFVLLGEFVMRGGPKDLLESFGDDAALVPAELYRSLLLGDDLDMPQGGGKSWRPGWEMYLRLDCGQMQRPAHDYWEKRREVLSTQEVNEV